MSTILIRADAGPAIGIGHVMRCLAVAEALSEAGHKVVFASAALPEALAGRIEAAGAGVRRLAADRGSAADLDATLAVVAEIGADAVILDGYAFDSAYRLALARATRPVLAFDDLADLDALHCHLVVNASPAAAGLPYDRLAPGATLLLGPAHAPLRRDIRRAAARPARPLGERDRILVTFGGADPRQLSAPVAAGLAEAVGPGVPIDLVLGSAVPQIGAVRARLERRRQVRVLVDPPDMPALMAGAGLAVSAAGGTTAELAALHVPTLLVIVADNQRLLAADAARAGWAQTATGDDGPGRIA
jgi:UDP-2,4-diacetamido-2,4,6-trideoxy-beta-L-altropyranose hydrolase